MSGINVGTTSLELCLKLIRIELFRLAPRGFFIRSISELHVFRSIQFSEFVDIYVCMHARSCQPFIFQLKLLTSHSLRLTLFYIVYNRNVPLLRVPLLRE